MNEKPNGELAAIKFLVQHTQNEISEVSQKLDKHLEEDNKLKADQSERLTRLETKSDALETGQQVIHGRIDKVQKSIREQSDAFTLQQTTLIQEMTSTQTRLTKIETTVSDAIGELTQLKIQVTDTATRVTKIETTARNIQWAVYVLAVLSGGALAKVFGIFG